MGNIKRESMQTEKQTRKGARQRKGSGYLATDHRTAFTVQLILGALSYSKTGLRKTAMCH